MNKHLGSRQWRDTQNEFSRRFKTSPFSRLSPQWRIWALPILICELIVFGVGFLRADEVTQAANNPPAARVVTVSDDRVMRTTSPARTPRTELRAPRRLRFESGAVAIEIDRARGRIAVIKNRLTGDTYRVVQDGGQIEFSDGTIDLATIPMSLVAQTKNSWTFVGRSPRFEVKRTYVLREDRGYFDRELQIKNLGTEPSVIKNVSDGALGFASPFESTAFHDDNMDQADPGSEKYSESEKPSYYHSSVNVFMGQNYGGLFAGLKYPYFKPKLTNDSLALTYEPNYRLKPGETLDLPTLFCGVYRNTGYVCRKELSWTPRVVSSQQEELDWGEVRAMQQVLRDYLPEEPAPRPGYFIWLNSWWANRDLQGRMGASEATAYCELADQVKKSKCIDLMSTAPVWCGWAGFIVPGPEIDAIGENAVFPHNPEIDRVMSYAKSLDLPISGFCEPNSLERHYRSDKPDWKVQPTPDSSKTLIQNCHANEAYEDWFYRLTCSAIDSCGLSGWAWDHSWLRRPMICYGANHGHELGNCEFQQYRNVTGMIARLRQRYPNVFMEIYWGLKEAGPWSLRGLNSLENAYENGSPPPPGMTVADDVRFQHWFSHNYRFIPTYLNMAQINFNKEANGHLYSLLSCLNASTHASLCDWIPFKTDAEADQVFALMRKWKAWATENMPYLRDRVDLFGMPCRKGGIDGTAHIIKDRGFIFVFNPSDAICYGSVVLNEMIGLTDGKKFSIEEISLDTPKPVGVYRMNDEFVFEIKPKSALLFELKPSKKSVARSAISLPSGETAQPAFAKSSAVR